MAKVYIWRLQKPDQWKCVKKDGTPELTSFSITVNILRPNYNKLRILL